MSNDRIRSPKLLSNAENIISNHKNDIIKNSSSPKVNYHYKQLNNI